MLFFLAGVSVLGSLAIAQRVGLLAEPSAAATATQQGPSAEYICPMMCVPPVKEPGRCPVCAMELVQADSGVRGDDRSIIVDPASRRVANIATVTVQSLPLIRRIRAVGELAYDEGTRKTIAAYSQGRFEKLYVDYTGAKVEKGKVLASFYSPELYTAQVEFLLADRTSGRSRELTGLSDERLKISSRQRLIELGMSPGQISELAQSGKADSRIRIQAPMSGTVIEKLISEGDYVKEGQTVMRLADLSSVWLMLELFPKDASAVRFGQRVEARVQSLPDRLLSGRVAFIDPDVDPQSRTVGVRVVIPNEEGVLRIGEFATAEITVPLGSQSRVQQAVYDPELADKWISPHHPHVVSDEPGVCRICGRDLVHASTLGFTDEPASLPEALIVPRDAVLMAAEHSVAYVETEPGRFEIRRVETGVTTGDGIVIRKGLMVGEAVAIRGAFLLDSQMQLSGNPSLIDPTRAAPPMKIVPGFTPDMLVEINKLPAEHAELAKLQGFCPVGESRLGSMGVPIPVDVRGRPIFVCCEGCREPLLRDPAKHLERLKALQEADTGSTAESSADDAPPIGEIEQFAAPPIGDIELPDMPPVGEIEMPPSVEGGQK